MSYKIAIWKDTDILFPDVMESERKIDDDDDDDDDENDDAELRSDRPMRKIRM